MHYDTRHTDLPCPVCQEPMRLERVHKTLVTVCDEHGLWLSPKALAAMLVRSRRATHRNMEKVVDKARTEGKFVGWMLGPWSLLGR